jgi:hypothetical protein
MANTFRPSSAMSVRHIESTAEDRKRDLREFKGRKQREQKLKEERFEKIRQRRKQNNSGQGQGINIEITGDKEG